MIEIIPAIDLIDGKCVRLRQGDYGQKTIYNENPLEVAKSFEAEGIHRLHLVDLDGAKSKHVVNIDVLKKITGNTKLSVDYGGGIKDVEDLMKVFDNGADYATVGSVAVTNSELFESWIESFGAGKFILGADVRDNNISISGWQTDTAIEIDEFIEGYLKKGIRNILCTDISKDGMLEGTSLELYRTLIEKFPDIKLIASGGVTRIDEIVQLDAMGVAGVIIGKAIYEGVIKLEELKQFV